MRTAAVVIGATLAIASPNPLKAETMISPDQMTEYTCAASENRLAMVEALQIRIVWVVESLAKGQKLTGNLDPADYLLRTPMTLDYNRGGIYFWNKQHPVDPANSEGVVVVQ
ncbi:MAG TPA: hypothetical protein PK765_06085 [bacterium]|nr:hypothetical protein [bacterium]